MNCERIVENVITQNITRNIKKKGSSATATQELVINGCLLKEVDFVKQARSLFKGAVNFNCSNVAFSKFLFFE